VQSYTITHFLTILLIVGDCFLLFDNLLKEVYNAFINTNLALKYYIKTRNAPSISAITRIAYTKTAVKSLATTGYASLNPQLVIPSSGETCPAPGITAKWYGPA
jgi:hypothetical protein